MAGRKRPYVCGNFLPKLNIDYTKKKSPKEKRVRDDKDAVLDMLFAAFEKHQYYNIKDLQMITRQPMVYLKEILKEICNYNYTNPHKNMWELKPEYRHYKLEQAAETKEEKNSSDSD
ncbi:general transcription factor IIF subunit 2-like isoform X1 [Spodoptera frugiperda]|uniref:General transcription factor IIF subunit 2 n=1 Tax=Spodoptera frugiperda TaxID=7108 RepID=A0A9R0D9R3_SPOFR|nr:general transcription factor IIF subunit 2-like isoform X1 [Spodoptera frugiperda]